MKLLIKVIFKFLSGLINLVLLPIDLLVDNALPGLTDALVYVNNLFDWLEDFTGWVFSWLPFSTAFYTFFISYLIFKFTIPLLVNTIKLVVKWWHALAP